MTCGGATRRWCLGNLMPQQPPPCCGLHRHLGTWAAGLRWETQATIPFSSMLRFSLCFRLTWKWKWKNQRRRRTRRSRLRFIIFRRRTQLLAVIIYMCVLWKPIHATGKQKNTNYFIIMRFEVIITRYKVIIMRFKVIITRYKVIITRFKVIITR